MSERKLLNAGQLAQILGISRSKAYRMMRLGEIPTIKIGEKSVRVCNEDLNEYIQKHRHYKGDQNV